MHHHHHSLPRGVDLSVELHLLLLKHFLQYLGCLRFAIGIVEVCLVDCLQQEMDLLWGFRSICVEDTQNQALDYVSEVALHGGAFLEEGALHIVVDFVLNCILVNSDRFVVNCLPIL